MQHYRTAVTLKIGEREVEGEVSSIDINPPFIRYPETVLFWGDRNDPLSLSSGSRTIGYPLENETLWDFHARMVNEVNEGEHQPWLQE